MGEGPLCGTLAQRVQPDLVIVARNFFAVPLNLDTSRTGFHFPHPVGPSAPQTPCAELLIRYIFWTWKSFVQVAGLT